MGQGAEGPAGWAAPLHERVLDLARVTAGTRVLDLGCGAGDLARRAAARGAAVLGVDTDPAAVARARADPPAGPATIRPTGGAGRAAPPADPGTAPTAARPAGGATGPGSAAFAVGDAHDPPPGPFDVVTAVQLLPHVADPRAVLRAAARVGERVAVTVWGRAGECDVRAFGEALAPWLGRPGPPPLTDPEQVRALVRSAGLEVTGLDEVVCPFAYPDADALVGPLLASGLGRAVIRRAGPSAVRDAVLARLEHRRTPDGGYVLRNLFRVLTAAPTRGAG